VVVGRRVAILLGAAILAASFANCQPQRIISTAPSVTEILYAIGLGDRVVGVTTFCHYPPEAEKKPKIGDYVNPNVEVMLGLKPDLVIVQTNPVRLAERLQALHLRTLEIDQQNIEGIYKSIRAVGDAAGVAGNAARLVDSMRAGLGAVRAKSAGMKASRVMFVIGRLPGRLDGLTVVGNASFLNEVIEVAGGKNVFRDAKAAYPKVSLEEVIARSPEVIIDMGDMSDTVGVTGEHKREVVALWLQRAATATAVKERRVFAVASDIYVVPGPRVVDAAREIFSMLHPERR
jgi:iron complex transport system substrate-binding protein